MITQDNWQFTQDATEKEEIYEHEFQLVEAKYDGGS